MQRFLVAAAHAAVLPCLLALAACGGGGKSSSPAPSPPAPPPPATFTVGGAIAGLAGSSVSLRLNGGADLVVAANGNFTFPGTIVNGTAYTVAIQSQPATPAQTCALANAGGTISANVTNVTVTCTTNAYRVRGTLSGLSGGSVALRNNGGDELALSADGPFEFAGTVPSGGAYVVTVQAQPSAPAQTCHVTQGTGSVAAADVTDVAVTCGPASFTIGGIVTGLNGSGLVLRNNGGDDLTVGANGAFTFGTRLVSGSNYLVSVRTQPTAPFQRCTVTSAGGSVLASDVTNVAIACVNTYSIGGTVRGLDVEGLVLRNSGGDDLTVSANGAFTFATRVPFGATYSVAAVGGTPASPRHVCQVADGAGTVSAHADVANVDVTCEADRFAYIAHVGLPPTWSPGSITILTSNHETGALAPIAGVSTFLLGAPGSPVSIVADPRGRFVYVASYSSAAVENRVSGFRVNPATGELSPVPGSQFAAGSGLSSLAIDSEGRFLYATNTNSDNVSGWAIQADGSLVPVPGSPYFLGFASRPESVATTPSGQCCNVYVTQWSGPLTQVSAFAYHPVTGALSPVTGSPFSFPNAYTPRSIHVSNTGETVWMSASGTSNITTMARDGSTGALTERPGSPTSAAIPCLITQPRLSSSIFAASTNHSSVTLHGEDPITLLPTALDDETMFVGSYCSIATDPYGEFVYLPNSNLPADYLFGYRVGAGGTTLEPLALDPSPAPGNTYTLGTPGPREMVLRYSRRDREALGVAD